MSLETDMMKLAEQNLPNVWNNEQDTIYSLYLLEEEL